MAQKKLRSNIAKNSIKTLNIVIKKNLKNKIFPELYEKKDQLYWVLLKVMEGGGKG